MKLPNFAYENRLWKKGYNFVAGLDEVGRGCFAGPVVCGCVVFPKWVTEDQLSVGGIRIDDSKRLTKNQREIAAKWIKDNSIGWGVGIGSVSKINKLGITKTTNFAFRSALKNVQVSMNKRVEYLLIDAFYIPYIRGLRMPIKRVRNSKAKKIFLKNTYFSANQHAVIDGDEKIVSVAAASILAKVYRDRLMTNLSKLSSYKKYNWDKNKGYGTKTHRDTIRKFGVTKYHRTKFVETFLSKSYNL